MLLAFIASEKLKIIDKIVFVSFYPRILGFKNFLITQFLNFINKQPKQPMFIIKRFFCLLFFIVIISCSHGIEVVEGNFVNGVKIYQYKASLLQDNENIVIGRIKVIDEVGGLGSPGLDISNKCQINIYDNQSFTDNRSSATNQNIIWATDFPNKGDISNIYNGYFATKVRGNDVYIYGLECLNKSKLEHDFIKSDYYISNNGERVKGYDIKSRFYFSADSSGEIYDIGSLTFTIDKNDKKSRGKAAKFQPTIDLKISNSKISNNQIDLITKIDSLPRNSIKIKPYELWIKVDRFNLKR